MSLAIAAIGLLLSRPAGPATRSEAHSFLSPASRPGHAVTASRRSPVVQRTLDGFLAGYLRYLYGHGTASQIKDATAALTRSLEQHPLRVPPGVRTRTPRVLRLIATPAPPGLLGATAIVSDGEVIDYHIPLFVTNSGGQWLVSGLEAG